MPRNFADRLLDEIDAKQNPSCIGLDVRVPEIPEEIRRKYLQGHKVYWTSDIGARRKVLLDATALAIREFNEDIITATHEIVPAYKPNIAFYEQYGAAGIEAFQKTLDIIRSHNCIPVTDAKRGDIGDTSQAYADGHLGAVELLDGSLTSSDINTDAITVVAYVGSDGINPFLDVAKRYGKGVIVLAKTSNDSSGELQDLCLDRLHGGRKVFEEMALAIHLWGEALKGSRGYSSVCAVVGANYPEHAQIARTIMERNIVLVPAYGFQGARGVHCMPNFNDDGYGALVNSARDIIYAFRRPEYRGMNHKDAARHAAIVMKNDLHESMKQAGKFPW